MAAQIVMNSGSPVTGSIEVAAATLITLSNFDNTGVLGWKWELVDKPAGSAATLSATLTATSTITPDLPGTYMIRLSTYTDAARTVLDDGDDQAAGVRYSGSFTWRLPGAGETLQFDASKGWKPEVNAILAAVRTQLLTDVALATLAANQTTNLLAADQVEFDTATVVGSKIAVVTTAGATRGQFTLAAGTYLLIGACRANYSASSGLSKLGWFSVTGVAAVGAEAALAGSAGFTTDSLQGVACALVTVAVSTVFELRTKSLTGTISNYEAGRSFGAAVRLQ